MNRINFVCISILAFGLMTGCGGGKETIVYEYEGFTISFETPKGFFTPSTERADYIRGSIFTGAVAYVGETFTMNVAVMGCSYTVEKWNARKPLYVDEPLYQVLEIGGVYAAYRVYTSARIQYAMLGRVEEHCIHVEFSPNDIKNMPSEKEAEYIQKCIELSTNKELLAIMKSLKISKK
jgi:hypothetical protein